MYAIVKFAKFVLKIKLRVIVNLKIKLFEKQIAKLFKINKTALHYVLKQV